MERWTVNSYGYPNPFGKERAQFAWEVFESFGDNADYGALKKFWSNESTHKLDPHTVESWKANFEECGLLYVLSGDNVIHITPGGTQLRTAVEAKDYEEFAWVGLNLMLRYPLSGTGRRSRGIKHESSDLPLYWFVLVALLELKGFWQSELSRVLSEVFTRAEAIAAIDTVLQIRAKTANIAAYPDPTLGPSGVPNAGVYNAINQVMVKGGLNHMLYASDRQPSPYFADAKENFWYLHDVYREIVNLALGAQSQFLPPGCSQGASLVQRIPARHGFSDEQAYFDFAGAPVTPLADAQQHAQGAAAPAVQYGGEAVFFLTAGTHFDRLDLLTIEGKVGALCVLATEQRVVMSDELQHTYLVVDKALIKPGKVQVKLRQARPIHDPGFVSTLFEGEA